MRLVSNKLLPNVDVGALPLVLEMKCGEVAVDVCVPQAYRLGGKNSSIMKSLGRRLSRGGGPESCLIVI